MGIVTVCNVISMVAMLWRTFVIADHLDVVDFGKVIICINFFVIVKMLLRPGLAETLQRFVPEFEAANKSEASSSLCWLCVYIVLAVGILIAGFTLLCSTYIADFWYDDLDLASPLVALGLVSALFLFREVATMLLRLADAFAWALLPAALISIIVPIYLISIDTSDFTVARVIYSVAVAEVLTLIVLVCALFIKVQNYWVFKKSLLRLEPLKTYKAELKDTLCQTSLFGVLNFGSHHTAVFLIGLLAGAKDVALIGMASQLAKPITYLQSSVGSAVAPEVSKLYTKGKKIEVLSILNKTMQLGGIALVCGLCFSYFVGPWLISNTVGENYVEALPIFYILVTAHMLVLMFTGFLPVAIARGEIKQRNIVVALRFIYLGIAIAVGLNAWSAVIVQLMGALSIRFFNDIPLYKRLKKEVSCKDISMQSKTL